MALGASLLAGISWICVLSTLNVSAQVALPEWVRARGLAVFVVFLFGALTLGSVLWGYLAGLIGLSDTNFVAAAGILVALPLTWRWNLLDSTRRRPRSIDATGQHRSPFMTLKQIRVRSWSRSNQNRPQKPQTVPSGAR